MREVERERGVTGRKGEEERKVHRNERKCGNASHRERERVCVCVRKGEKRTAGHSRMRRR